MAERPKTTLTSPDPAFLAEVEAFENRTLTPEEFSARASTPMLAHEREELADHVSWFVRRHPSAAERFRAITHLTRQWLANR